MKTALFTAFFMVLATCVPAQESDLPPMFFRTSFSSVAKGTLSYFSVHRAQGATYHWNYPSSWKVVKGQGTPDIVFETDDNSASGIVSVEEVRREGRREAKVHVIVQGATLRQPQAAVAGFNMKAFPSVSTSAFTVQLSASPGDESVQLSVRDMAGRLVEMRSGLAANSTLQIGAGYSAGAYILEVRQGEQRREAKLVKQ